MTSVRSWWILAAASALGLALAGCSTNNDAGALDGSVVHLFDAAGGPACAKPAAGCACATSGEIATCTVFEQRSGDYTTCQVGTMTCKEGVWGGCASATAEKLVLSTKGIHVNGVGTTTACVDDPCDPSESPVDGGTDDGGIVVPGCNQVIDTPDGLDAGAGFTITDAGLTPSPNLTSEAGVACAGLTINPPTLTVEVTALSPLAMTPTTADFTATYTPSNCYTGIANASWSVDKRDLAAISGGVVTLVSAVAGPINVSAYASGFSAGALLNVTTNVLDTSQVTPAVAAKFAGNGTTPDSIRWLYPYASTVFPRSVAAPIVQWDNLGAAASAVKVTIQYPATGTPIYTVSEILPESTPPQAAISQLGWAYLDQTAAGQDALISIQRLVGGVLRNPVTETIHFGTAPLRGNIFYTEYNDPLWTATVKSAKPFGTTQAQVALLNSGCNPCHSVSANGTTLVASNWGNNDTSIAKVNADGTLTGIGNMWNQPSPPAQDSRGFAYSAISADGTLALQGSNWWGNTIEPGSTTQTASAPHGNGSGLTGAYFANTTQTGTPAFTEDDYTVDFNWGSGSPGASIAAGSTYSVSWTGFVQAIFNETYTFEVESSDGAQLTVGGQMLVNQLGVQADTKVSGTIAMTAGTKVPIKLVYQNLSDTSQVHLRWKSTSQPYQIIPVTQLYPSAVTVTTGLTGSYYANVTSPTTFNFATATPTGTRLDPLVDFNWSGASPIAGVGGNSWAAEWDGKVTIPCTGTYSFCVTGDDGVRLSIDGTLVDNGWVDQGPTQYCGPTSTMTQGSQHTVKMQYYQNGGGSGAEFQWNSACAGNEIIPSAYLVPAVIPPPPTNGLTGTYYSNISFSGMATTEIDPTVNFNWNGTSPAANIGGDNWSAEWTGQVEIPCTDNYEFCVVGDDGVRLWVDGNLVDNGWVSQGPTMYCDSVNGGTMAETAGTKHDIKMDYFQGGGGSVAQLEWLAGCLGGSTQVIPQADLFPSGDQGTGGYNIPFHNAGDLGTGSGYSILELPTVVGGSPVDVTGPTSWGLGTTAMMVPAFSPDGTKLVFVDGDTSGGASWRQGLSFFNFNGAAQTFTNRTNFVDTVSTGMVIRWPAVESDSQSVIYQTNPTTQDDANSYAQYGGMLPSAYSTIPGQLWSVDMAKPLPVSLNNINAGLGGTDTNHSYQPTVLPTSAGGYRWTVFASDRQYGNTQNIVGSGVAATMQLWVGALDDTVSANADRSHPPFWLPNQILGTNGGDIRNERAYWVLDACKPSLASLNPPGGSTPPPFTWMDQDIGSPGDPAIAGTATASGGTITVTAGGDDIWNTNDAFHYAYVPVSGDFQFVARVVSLAPADVWSKAGIMLRDNLASDSAFAHMMISAGSGTGYQWRTPTGNGCSWTPGTASAFPYWLRLTRTGTVVTADGSTDGMTWANVGTLTPAIGNNAYLGLAVTAHNNSTFTTAVFDNVGFVSVAGASPLPGSLCQDDQDCCDALTTPATAACEVDVPLASPVTRHCILLTGNSCVALGATCVSDSDCCGFPTNHCDTKGVCAVPPPPFPYGDTIFTRDYVADCPVGMVPNWHFFDWESITPADSDIKFLAATAASSALLPTMVGAPTVVPFGEASGPPVTMWGTGADVWEAMKAANQEPDLQYLRIFADFQPTSDGSQVPTLVDWRQQYDCVAAE